MTKRKKVSVKKSITRRRNTFNNYNFKEENNMKDEKSMVHGEVTIIHGAGDGISPDWDI